MGIASKLWNHLGPVFHHPLKTCTPEGTTQLLFRLDLFPTSPGLRCIFREWIKQGSCVCSGEFLGHRSVVSTRNPSTKNATVGGLLGAPDQPRINSEFKVSLNYIETLSQEHRKLPREDTKSRHSSELAVV